MEKKSLQILTLDADALMVEGPDAFQFLQGMFTADLKRGLGQNPFHPYGGASFLLDQKAKIVAPSKFWIFSKDCIYFSLPAGESPAVRDELEKFHVADDLQISIPTVKPWAKMCFAKLASPDALGTAEKMPGPGEGAKDKVFKLQSHSWGWSLPLADWASAEGVLDCHQLWIQDWQGFESSYSTENLSAESLLKLRMERGIPEWPIDWNKESFILEFPHATEISFFKGCYKGQEIVARGTYRGTLPKSFMHFQAVPGATLICGFVFNTMDPEKPVGKITSVHGGAGVGVLRLSALNEGRLFQVTDDRKRVEIAAAKNLVKGDG